MKELNIEALRRDIIFYASKDSFDGNKELKDMYIDKVKRADESELKEIATSLGIPLEDYYHFVDRKKRSCK